MTQRLRRRLPLAVLVCVVAASLVSTNLAARRDTHYETIVKQIQKADYEGNRAELDALFSKSEPFLSDKKIASRVRYWRGFAKWRRAINGFNEKDTPNDLESDLLTGVEEFKKSYELDPTFVDGKIGHIGCVSLIAFLHSSDLKKAMEIIEPIRSIAKECRDAQPDNPRFAWVIGPGLLKQPVERGGGFDGAIKYYNKALEYFSVKHETTKNSLEPMWGEAELHMSLAWTHQNKEKPDLKSAEEHARKALKMVPNWHYVKDILLPSILADVKKASGGG